MYNVRHSQIVMKNNSGTSEIKSSNNFIDVTAKK